ncbi:hypothetical protein M1O47_01940 [Dehalococcoidia bacterium]|nr:hypothetical protein [Dehalococcoidia bacterium]
MKDPLPQITRWADHYTKFELEVAIKYFEDLRDNCTQVIEENANSNTKSELIVYRITSLIITKLQALQIGRI